MKTLLPSPRLLALLLPLLGFSLASAPAQVPVPAPGKAEKKYVPYRIARGDTIAVVVFDEPNLTAGGKRVDSSRGTITMPLITEARVVGMTILEAQAAIENAYRDGRFLRNPQVTITVESYAPRVVIVSGKVNNPGRHELPPDTETTIMDMIFKAGGFSETARANAVRVTRTMPDGSLKVHDLDVDSAIKGRTKSTTGDAAFVLQPDDVIWVPERMI
ncbi:MAG: polysaccharide biosynthesis/export family protein [Opitutus sp.]